MTNNLDNFFRLVRKRPAHVDGPYNRLNPQQRLLDDIGSLGHTAKSILRRT